MGKMQHFEIRNGDAFEFLSGLEPESVDLIVSSPPYFMGKEYDKGVDVTSFEDIHSRLLPLLSAALKPGGSVCWQVGSHISNGLLTPLDAIVYNAFRGGDLQLRNRIIWTFGHGTHAKKRLSGRYETILWYSKGAKYYFDLDSIRVPQKYPGKRHYKGPKKGELSGNPLGKNPGDVWEIPNVNANHVEKTDHPCQFPVALVQRLVRALCPQNGLVVDPFAGSGTTGVAANIEGRRFVGSELEARYVDIAIRRAADLEANVLRWRDLSQPILAPDPRTSVARRPEHFWEENT